MNAYVLVPAAALALAIGASFFIHPDRLGLIGTFATFSLASWTIFYLAIYGLLSLASELSPPSRAAWAFGVPAGLGLLLSPIPIRTGRAGFGFMSMDIPVSYLLTVPGQLALAPGFRHAKSAHDEREARKTPDPCSSDLLSLDRTGKFEVVVHDVALQPDLGIVLLVDLRAPSVSGTRLSRFQPDGKLDRSFALVTGCLPQGSRRIEIAPAGELLVHGENTAELLSPTGEHLATLEVGDRPDVFGYRFDASGALWSLRASEAGLGVDPITLDELWPPREGPLRRIEVRPAISQLGPVNVVDFFYGSAGELALVAERIGEGGSPVLIRIHDGGRVEITERPVGPSQYRGALDGGQILLADRWAYEFRADLVSAGGVKPELEALVRGTVHATAAAALGRWIVLAGNPSPDAEPDGPRGFRVVRMDAEGRIDSTFELHKG